MWVFYLASELLSQEGDYERSWNYVRLLLGGRAPLPGGRLQMELKLCAFPTKQENSSPRREITKGVKVLLCVLYLERS